MKKDRALPQKDLWAYAYEISLPLGDERLTSIKELLRREHEEAVEDGRRWAGHVVVEPLVTQILVVSDGPDIDHEVSHRLEAGLEALNARFVVTAPLLVVVGEPTQPVDVRSEVV